MFEPGRIMSSVTCSGSTPGGTNSDFLMNFVVFDGGGLGGEVFEADTF